MRFPTEIKYIRPSLLYSFFQHFEYLNFKAKFTQIWTKHMQKTSKQYDQVIATCRALFINKMADYGSAWRILRLPSLTDQIFIKAQRIRSLQQNQTRRVEEDEKRDSIGLS